MGTKKGAGGIGHAPQLQNTHRWGPKIVKPGGGGRERRCGPRNVLGGRGHGIPSQKRRRAAG